jgi:hypothetical protein
LLPPINPHHTPAARKRFQAETGPRITALTAKEDATPVGARVPHLPPVPDHGPAGARGRLGLMDELVSEVSEALTDGPGVEEPHGFLVAGLAEEALAGTEHDRENHQPQLVDQAVLD